MGITTPHIIFHPSSNKSKYNFSLHDAKVTKHKSIYRKKNTLLFHDISSIILFTFVLHVEAARLLTLYYIRP